MSFGGDAGTGSVQRIVYGNRAPRPVASATPAQGIAPLAVTLSAAGTIDPDGEAMTYEWDLDGDGSVGCDRPDGQPHLSRRGAHRATLTVRDARGLAASDTVEVLADESPPTATLIAPAARGSFRYGRPIELEGAAHGRCRTASSATRRCTGGSPSTTASTRTWSRRTAPGREITFTPPGDHDADSALELRLTARDSAGLEDTETVTLRPETIDLRLESSPPGAVLSYAGLDVTAPALRTAAVGFHPTVSAPAALERGGRRFLFDRWSDGGERLHEIVIPDADLTLTAIYTPMPEAAPPPAAPGPAAAAAQPAAPGARRGAPDHVRRPGGAGALAAARAAASWERPGRCASTSRCGCGAAPVAAAGGGGRCGRLSTAARSCDRPVWMTVAVDGSGRWRLDLRGRPRPGRYAVLTRAMTGDQRARGSWCARRAQGSGSRRTRTRGALVGRAALELGADLADPYLSECTLAYVAPARIARSQLVELAGRDALAVRADHVRRLDRPAPPFRPCAAGHGLCPGRPVAEVAAQERR